MSQMQARAIQVVSKASEQRLSADIEVILPWLKKKSQLQHKETQHGTRRFCLINVPLP